MERNPSGESLSGLRLVLPDAAAVRGRIEAIPDGPFEAWYGVKRPTRVVMDGEKLRVGLMYQSLIAGRPVEAFGKYGPRGLHAVKVKMNGETSVLLAAKTAKRKTKRGWTMRPCVVPLNPAYEPWAQIVYKYIHRSEDSAFKLHDKWIYSQRFASSACEQVFDGLWWRYVNYSKTLYADPSLGLARDPDTRKRVQLREGEAAGYGGGVTWKRVPGWDSISVSVEDRWKPFRGHRLRARRVQDLEMYYGFNDKELSMYGGWESKTRGAAMRHYLELDLDESPEGIIMLCRMAKRYFPKLLRPIASVLNPQEAETEGIEIVDEPITETGRLG